MGHKYDSSVGGSQDALAGHCICCGQPQCIYWVVCRCEDEGRLDGFGTTLATSGIVGNAGFIPGGLLDSDALLDDAGIVEDDHADEIQPTGEVYASTAPKSTSICTPKPHNALSTQNILPSHDQSAPGLVQRQTVCESSITILAQEQYQARQVMVVLYPPIQFDGCNLHRALTGETSDLVGGSAAAFGVDVFLPQKMSIILMLPGHARYSHQANILRARQTPPTRAQLATTIAREVLRFLKKASEEGTPLQFDGHSILGLQDLVLMEVRHVSKSSIQPVIGIMHR